MAGKGGGAWKVAYADFVTAMMAFFLVMWIVGQDKPVKQAVAQYFEDPLGIDKGSRFDLAARTRRLDHHRLISRADVARPRLGMAQNKVGGRALVGVSAKRPPHIVIFRHFNRTYSVGTVIVFAEDSAARTPQPRRASTLFLCGQAEQGRNPRYAPRERRPPAAPLRMECSWPGMWMATKGHLTEHDIDSERIRLTQEEPSNRNSLHGRESERIPGSRGEIFVLDEYVDKGRNPVPQSGGPEDEDPS